MDPALQATIVGVCAAVLGWGLRAVFARGGQDATITIKLDAMAKDIDALGKELHEVRLDVGALTTRDAQRGGELKAIKSDIDELKEIGRVPTVPGGWRRS